MANENVNVNDLRALIVTKNAGWQAGATSVSGLSEDEKKKRLGATPPSGEASLRERENIAAANIQKAKAGIKGVGFPTSFDWRNNGGNYITAVKDQGGCGSCVAFGSVATTEGTYQVVKGNPNSGIDLSEAQLFYCYGTGSGVTCETGWWPDQAFNSIEQGLADEACYPYTAGDQNCTNLCADWANRAVRISAWHQITDVNQMKDWLSTRGPLSTCFTVYNDFFYYTSGIYTYVSGDVAGGHCVSVVGYSEDNGGYWICKNSWGTGWGESGFFCIAYGQCGIDATMWAVDGIVDTGWLYNKLILGLWTIDQDLNAWAYVDGEGWKKISNDNDNIFLDMLSQLISAKASGKTVSLYIENSVVKQIYVNS